MKFSEMPYARPDLAAVKQQFADLLARFKAAATYAEAHAVFLEEEKLNKHVDTLAQLASVRNTIDTRDKFYDEEMNFWNEATPQLQECQNAWSRAMLDSPFRADFTAEYGDLMFVNAEIADKAFSPDILDEMAQENKLTTEYGKLIDEVISLQRQRKYTETIPVWEKIKAANNNFDLAYVGIGKSLMQQGEYDKAMDYFYAADVPEQYSLAMKQARSESLENFAILIPLAVILLVVLLVKLFAKAREYNHKEALAGGEHSTKSGLIYGTYVIFHPFDGFWDIQHEKRGNLRSALIILAILLISAVASTPVTAYLFSESNRLESTFFRDLLNVLLPLILWCVANWCLTSLMDGKGSFKDIFISVCYAVIPLCFMMLPAALLTNALSLDEATIITYMMNIAYVWTGILIVASSMTVHSYSFGKNIMVCLLTIVGMAIILFLAMLFLSVSNRMISFIGSLISEISIRF